MYENESLKYILEIISSIYEYKYWMDTWNVKTAPSDIVYPNTSQKTLFTISIITQL
jgi:hypothetical protein